jgi:hypothetical protein
MNVCDHTRLNGFVAYARFWAKDKFCVLPHFKIGHRLRSSELLYDWPSVSQYVLVSSTFVGLATRYYFVRMLLSEICGLVSVERPLWREDESTICSVITQWSESRRTRNQIYCLIWDSPNLETATLYSCIFVLTLNWGSSSHALQSSLIYILRRYWHVVLNYWNGWSRGKAMYLYSEGPVLDSWPCNRLSWLLQ